MNPPMRLRVVVLPQPEGPSRQKNSPGSMTIETWSRAVTSPYCLVAFRSSMAGVESGNVRAARYRGGRGRNGRRAGFGAGSGAARGASASRARAVRADGGPGHDGRAPGVRPGINSLLCNRLYDASVRPMARQYIVAPAGRRAPG